MSDPQQPWRGETSRPPNTAILEERLRNLQQEIREIREQNERWHIAWAERAERRHNSTEERITKLEFVATRADTLRMIASWVLATVIALTATAVTAYKAIFS